MRWGLVIALALGLAASCGVAEARPPVVVELFTAQGCSSCSRASADLSRLADEKGVLALTFAVDYWDYLGWKDTFAKPEFTQRQKSYAGRLGVADVYTPQVIVDGRLQSPAVKADDVEARVREARRQRLDPPQMRFRGARVAVGSGHRPPGGAEIWLVRYDPRAQTVEVKNGDNRGQSVVERNVVVQLERLGAWRGRPVLLAMPPAPADGLRTVVLVQGADGGKILGVLASDEAQ